MIALLAQGCISTCTWALCYIYIHALCGPCRNRDTPLRQRPDGTRQDRTPGPNFVGSFTCRCNTQFELHQRPIGSAKPDVSVVKTRPKYIYIRWKDQQNPTCRHKMHPTTYSYIHNELCKKKLIPEIKVSKCLLFSLWRNTLNWIECLSPDAIQNFFKPEDFFPCNRIFLQIIWRQ